MSDSVEKLRVDKWLWHARFFKTRTLAAAQVKAGALRINGTLTQKPASTIVPTDVLTFAQGDHIRVIQIDALGVRRGPAPEAQALYTDLSPPEPKNRNKQPENPGFDGKGRPSKKDRRTLDLSKARYLE
ncbi:RNA-binding S4 domain-containing protein [Sulfitobacter sp. M57]|uniref:RNA-binding S4 domain-containing protein n=1 Tax=unclassified Sulfitobacter TaxID=196795 RepID=UPI0023E2A461|nr:MULTISPECIES: RNA-binding S4 domain-containing protein [unclassified Sulfitobacter]MDF3413181.1 RNA-binding S4 domain-containing protein [Sulfitobacter sp. KE5]MDF3421536.1 RNA-binding S4 domain-containing protein [Sulfitobacter sp. KE43]MDF3431730.1 RNA-binding S4 domain-containing protein [Sulfitobacter sp. KE42]MDF3457371.1 RNA-binding S4 domain-containing protein [Sulfitobacter sp. S74]MDF3461273.1 RNA-binding S4 domain-containing protein [Sulfitobacter sp. Ks18]